MLDIPGNIVDARIVKRGFFSFSFFFFFFTTQKSLLIRRSWKPRNIRYSEAIEELKNVGGALKHFQDITVELKRQRERCLECLVHVVGIHAFTNKEVKMQPSFVEIYSF